MNKKEITFLFVFQNFIKTYICPGLIFNLLKYNLLVGYYVGFLSMVKDSSLKPYLMCEINKSKQF